MRISTPGILPWLMLATASLSAEDLDLAARDAAARIDFGWFTNDEPMIVAAGRALEAGSGDPWHAYLRSYAAYRTGQLQLARGSSAGAAIDACQDEAERAAASPELEIEATVLRAACAALAVIDQPLRAVLHQRRLRQALQRAESLDPDNPRLLLIATQYSVDSDAAVQPSLSALLEAFLGEAERDEFPDWGYVEALTLVAAQQLGAGDLRRARDLVEEALLLAPDYDAARELQRRLSSIRAGN